MKTLYELLGVTPQASLNAIEQSYLRLVRKLDPESPANQASMDARAQYHAVHAAYRTLSDPAARRQYDLGLRTRSRLRMPHARTIAGEL